MVKIPIINQRSLAESYSMFRKMVLPLYGFPGRKKEPSQLLRK
jgi:hypothetical protein